MTIFWKASAIPLYLVSVPFPACSINRVLITSNGVVKNAVTPPATLPIPIFSYAENSSLVREEEKRREVIREKKRIKEIGDRCTIVRHIDVGQT